MSGVNGHAVGAQIDRLAERLDEAESRLPSIEELRMELITTRSAVAHLGGDFRLMRHEFMQLKSATLSAVSAVHRLETTMIDFIAEVRRHVK